MSVISKQADAAPPKYAEAIERVLAHVAPIHEAETEALDHCGRRVLAEDVIADRDLPPFNRATMDGYALRAADFAPGKRFPVVATIPAGHDGVVDVPTGACVAIATGAPIPPQLDTVIQHEKSDRANPVTFSVDSIEPGHAVHPRGADARKGQAILPARTLLRAHHLGIAASVGATSLRIARCPRTVIITSGDEIIEPARKPATHHVRNSNAPMLTDLLQRMGGEAILHEHLPDDFPAVLKAVAPAFEPGPPSIDMLITVGGISAGERDHFRTAFEEHHVAPIVTRALLQPGGPIYVGRHPNGCMLIGLPGNPVSVLACACLFVWPVLQRMLGLDGQLPWRTVELAAPVKPNATRQAYRPANLEAGRAVVPAWAGSGDLVHTAATDGLLELPIQKEPVEAGTRVRFLPWP